MIFLDENGILLVIHFFNLLSRACNIIRRDTAAVVAARKLNEFMCSLFYSKFGLIEHKDSSVTQRIDTS